MAEQPYYRISQRIIADENCRHWNQALKAGGETLSKKTDLAEILQMEDNHCQSGSKNRT